MTSAKRTLPPPAQPALFPLEAKQFPRQRISWATFMDESAGSALRDRRDVFNGRLVKGLTLVGHYEIPKIEACTLVPDRLIAFSEAVGMGEPDPTAWVHGYEDDYKTERLWRSPEEYFPKLRGFAGVKSTITVSITELQDLVELNAGTGVWYPPNREVVDFGVVIGKHRNSKTGYARPTTRGTIHYSKTGCSCRSHHTRKGEVAMTYFHPEEEFQFGVLEEYDDNHPGIRYLVEFPDGESYVCRSFALYESENGGELDIEMDDPRYDEFYQIAMDIVETIETGGRRYHDGLTLDYRDWPALIKDVDRDAVVYRAG